MSSFIAPRTPIHLPLNIGPAVLPQQCDELRLLRATRTCLRPLCQRTWDQQPICRHTRNPSNRRKYQGRRNRRSHRSRNRQKCTNRSLTMFLTSVRQSLTMFLTSVRQTPVSYPSNQTELPSFSKKWALASQQDASVRKTVRDHHVTSFTSWKEDIVNRRRYDAGKRGAKNAQPHKQPRNSKSPVLETRLHTTLANEWCGTCYAFACVTRDFG